MPADRGFVLFWRKSWDSKLFKRETFTEIQAWFYLWTNLAQGIDRNGVGRGQFEVSESFLAKRWLWSISRVHRFLAKLQQENMIERVNKEVNKQSNRFIVCKYETYQNIRTSNRTSDRTQSKERVNKRENTKAIPASPKHKSASVPAGFKIEESMLAWASQHVPSVNVESETASFLDHHTAKGSTFRDWTAAWRTWMRNSQKWQKPSYHQETIDEQLERLRRKNDSKPGSVVR